jgi:hypothetical protein
MPGGLANPIAGYAAFTAVKLGGYSLAAVALNRKYPEAKHNFALVGATRTGIGMAVGFVLISLAWPLVVFGGPVGVAAYFAGLIPARLFEWWLLILIFYDRARQTKQKDWRYAGAGTAWSFLLDVPALVGLFATGGFWIC